MSRKFSLVAVDSSFSSDCLTPSALAFVVMADLQFLNTPFLYVSSNSSFSMLQTRKYQKLYCLRILFSIFIYHFRNVAAIIKNAKMQDVPLTRKQLLLVALLLTIPNSY